MKILPFMRRLAIATLIAGVYSFTAATAGSYHNFETAILDFWFNQRGALPPPKDVVIAGITEESYREMNVPGFELWPRRLHAFLLRKLAAAGAAGVAFDVVFAGHSPDPGTDRELAEAMKLLPVLIVEDILELNEPGLTQADAIEKLTPIPELKAAAKDTGTVTTFSAKTVNRHFPFGGIRRWRPEESLAFKSASLLRTLAGVPTPLDFINWYGDVTSNQINLIPIHKLLRNDVRPEDVRGKIIVVGDYRLTPNSSKSLDLITSPLSPRTPGVALQATATANLLEHNWIRRADSNKEGLRWAGLLLLASVLIISLEPVNGAFFVIVLVAGWAISSWLFFRNGYFIGGGLAALVFLPITFLGSTVYYYFLTSKRQRQIRNAFSRYLAPVMVDRLAANPDALKLGGELRHCALMFTDAAGFTSLAESKTPQDVVALLNRYFSGIAGAVHDKQGTVVKFLGDGVFAIWGAPLEAPDHAKLALEAARQIAGLADQWNGTELAGLSTRVGLHCGEVVVGNIGTEDRIDYTAIGDAVNLASRLEQLNKRLGTTMLASEELVSHAKAASELLYIGRVRVAGRGRPLGLYTSLPEREKIPDTKIIDSALSSFAARDWPSARQRFERLKEGAGPVGSALWSSYLKQIDDMQVSRPPEDWRGELVFLEK